jgi:hypothetical protein
MFFEDGYIILSVQWVADSSDPSVDWPDPTDGLWQKQLYFGNRRPPLISRIYELKSECRMGNGFDGAGVIVAWQNVTARHGYNRGVAIRPLWLAAPLAIYPAIWFACRGKRWRETRRLRAGLCPGCGYDLRASKDRCPECGRVIMADDRGKL